jgi:hypothetical protein
VVLVGSILLIQVPDIWLDSVLIMLSFSVLARPELTLRQNKHVLRASRGPTKICQQGNLFNQPGIRLKSTPKLFLIYRKN